VQRISLRTGVPRPHRRVRRPAEGPPLPHAIHQLRRLLRKLENLVKKSGPHGIAKEKILVQLASCITKDNHHSPRCPHAEFIRELVARAGLACREDTVISAQAEQRRKDGTYKVTKRG
jgi:hypothetical protein